MESTVWKRSKAEIFWGELAPVDHVVQIYENDDDFLDVLSGFIGGGINSGECVIIIATAGHLKALDTRLHNYGISVKTLIDDDRYIPLNAEEILSRFMVNDWPDEALFMQAVNSIIEKGNKKNRRIRAFGEMVALLWAQGLNGATIHLEYLWNKFCSNHEFCLFCAYPKSSFTQDINESMTNICNCHTKMISSSKDRLNQITYIDLAYNNAV
jgi:hypothetical protein